MASVLRHHVEIDQGPDASESTLEWYKLGTPRLTQLHSQKAQNTSPKILHLFLLPLRNLMVGFFRYKESRVRQ